MGIGGIAHSPTNIGLNDSLNADNDRFDTEFDLQTVLVRFQAEQYKVPGQRDTTEAIGGEIARETMSEYTASRPCR